MQFVEVGVPHEIVQTFMHVNVGITSFYMWGSHGCALFTIQMNGKWVTITFLITKFNYKQHH